MHSLSPAWIVLNPAFAMLGLVALAAPLLAHLLSRNIRREVWFPSLEFLRNVAAQQSKIYRLRHWILLALRCAIIALLAAVFLRPVLERNSLLAVEDAGNAGAVALVLLDVSASMGYRDGPATTRFERARSAARRLFDDLPGDATRNLILVGAKPTPVLPRPSTKTFHIKQALDAARTSAARANVDAAIAEAIAQVRGINNRRVELHLVSDFQRSNWSSVDLSKVPEEIKVVFVRIEERSPPENAWLDEISLEPPVPSANETVTLRCRVGHVGPNPRSVPVVLKVGDQAEQRQSVELAPGASADAVFSFVLNKPGNVEASLSIPDDRLSIDNQRFVTVHCAERRRVLVVSDATKINRAVPQLLKAALDPFPADAGEPSVSSPFSAQILASDKLGALSPQREQAVVLAATDSFSEQTRQRIGDYLASGGSVIAFLHTAMDGANLLALEAQLADLTLPFAPGVMRRFTPKEGEGVHITQANLNHPMLRAFRDSDDLAKVSVPRHFSTERQSGGTLLARYNTGQIALAQTSVGAGTLVVANVSPHPDNSDLARRLLFVPLVHEMVEASLPRSGLEAQGPSVGESAVVTLDGDASQLVFLGPDDDRIEANLSERPGEISVILSNTDQPGFYRIQRAGETLHSVAVNLDARESRLESMPVADVEKRASGAAQTASGTDLAELTRLREGWPIWPWLLLGVLALLASEQVLWLVWRRS